MRLPVTSRRYLLPIFASLLVVGSVASYAQELHLQVAISVTLTLTLNLQF
jgi:hypothetical protein